MSHQLTIDVADDVYQPLQAKAKEAGQSVEMFAQECLADAVRCRGALIRKWMGAVESNVPDAAQRHDFYLGEALAQDLKGGSDD